MKNNVYSRFSLSPTGDKSEAIKRECGIVFWVLTKCAKCGIIVNVRGDTF